MKEQVLSVKQMQTIVKLGIDTSNASMCWLAHDNYELDGGYLYSLCIGYLPSMGGRFIPTFTLQDILEIIKEQVLKKDLSLDLQLDLLNSSLQLTKEIDYILHIADGDNILETAFNMLKWVKENEYI